MNVPCTFRTWPYSYIWLRNTNILGPVSIPIKEGISNAEQLNLAKLAKPRGMAPGGKGQSIAHIQSAYYDLDKADILVGDPWI